MRNGLQTACTSPQPSTTGGLAALETTCTIRQRGAVVMKQTLLTAAGKTSAYSLSYAGLAEAYDASQAEIRAVRKACASSERNRTRSGRGWSVGGYRLRRYSPYGGLHWGRADNRLRLSALRLLRIISSRRSAGSAGPGWWR
ncbi:DUF4946 domain-containing protein [Pseudomonas aeruginosa]|nr:DUF4946 domain-containing protein [Pseudomonas aeruginosa]